MKHARSEQGSLILLVLCMVAVVGIALASYLSLGSQSMKLSNRLYAKDVSLKLAEMGLEQALRSFNYNTFGSWTLSGNTASQTFSVSSARYGSSGFTTAVNIRVDNHNAFIQDAVWNTTTNYRVDQFVLYSGNWYRAFNANKNSIPSSGTDWSVASGSATATWNISAYNIGDIVYRTSAWYRALTANTNQAPPNVSWSTAPLLPINWTSGAYNLNDIVYDRGFWYRCTLAHIASNPPPNASYWASADTSSWSTTTTYLVNDYVSNGGVWYRCIQGNTNITPNNASYWATNAPVVYAEGVVTLPDGTSTIKTQVRAIIANAPLFPNAAAAANTLTFSSGGTVDSYDSSRGVTGTSNYNSTSSPYSGSSPNLGDSAVLAGGNTSSNAVVVTSTNIKGYIAAPSNTTSPYAPRYSVGGSARLTNTAGAVTSPHPTAANVDLTRIVRSPYIPRFDILSPNTGASTTLPTVTSNLGFANDTTWRTYTAATGLDIRDGRIYTIDGPVRIVVSGAYYQNLYAMSLPPTPPPGQIIISNNSRAKLEMFISGDIAIYGNGIDNQTRIPANLAIYATTTSTAPDFNTATDFYGTIYFTNSSSRFTVLGNRTFYGAISANHLTFSASPIIHYDTALRYTTFSGVDSPFVITVWRELTDPAEKVTLP